MYLFFSRGLALIACLFSLPSVAQQAIEQSFLPYLGTVSVKATPAYADGHLTGCHLEFNTLIRDWTYRQGGFLRVGGSVGVLSGRNGLAVTLKVIVHELDATTAQFVPSVPASAYLIDGTTTTKSTLIASQSSDTPGALFSVFQLSPSGPLILQGIEAGKIVIAFARKPGGMDIIVPVETDVVDTNASGFRIRSPRISEDFLRCIGPLMRSAR